VARSRNHCSNVNVTMCSGCIVEPHDTINNIKILNASQKCDFYGKFVTCNNKTYVRMSSCKLTYIFGRFFNKCGVSRQIFLEAPNAKVYGKPSRGRRADTCGQTDGHNEDIRRFSRLFERA
jgi:hypothetical protein